MTQNSGHGTMNATLPGTRIAIPCFIGIRSREIMMCDPRLGTIRAPPNGLSALAAQTPVASTTFFARIRMSSPLTRSCATSPFARPPSSTRPSARMRVTGRPPRPAAVRATASTYRASSSAPSW